MGGGHLTLWPPPFWLWGGPWPLDPPLYTPMIVPPPGGEGAPHRGPEPPRGDHLHELPRPHRAGQAGHQVLHSGVYLVVFNGQPGIMYTLSLYTLESINSMYTSVLTNFCISVS